MKNEKLTNFSMSRFTKHRNKEKTMTKHTGFIVIVAVTIFMLIATVTAGVIEANRRADITTVPQDKIAELIKVPIEEQDADASNKGMIEQDRKALGIMKDSFIVNVNKCMDSQDYTTVKSCVDALNVVFPKVDKKIIEEPLEEEKPWK